MPKKKTKDLCPSFDLGKEIFSWKAYDYYPYQRGTTWFVLFCLIVFGPAVWAAFIQDWIMAITMWIAGACYLFIHRDGVHTHVITIYEDTLCVGKRHFPWSYFSGYWFVYHPHQQVAVIHFPFKRNPNNEYTLQMGDTTPSELRNALSRAGLRELENKHECVMDLWSRVLKL